MFDKPLAIVDVETTGISPGMDRIIEIGILRIENGKLVDKYNTLINPQRHVPPFIQALTGIDAKELEEAPLFSDILKKVDDFFEDAYFVAHNVRFDYGFIKSEFKREQIPFKAKTLCTVQLSRRLFPRYRRHGLSALIDRFQFEYKRRHRAYDDALILWEFIKLIKKKFPLDEIKKIIAEITKSAVNAPKNVRLLIEDLPESPGVYIMYDKNNLPLYVGKSLNIQDRLKSHYSQDYHSIKEISITKDTAYIDHIQTAGELGALLTESKLIKEIQPVYNRKLRKKQLFTVLIKTKTKEGFLTVKDKVIDSFDDVNIEDILNSYNSKKNAKAALCYLAEKYNLCHKLLGLEKTKSACFNYEIGQCKGACCGEESVKKYNARFIIAFLENRLFKPWPFSGPIEITEYDEENEVTETFVVDNWRLEGKQFDIDVYKILLAQLARNKLKNRIIKQYSSF